MVDEMNRANHSGGLKMVGEVIPGVVNADCRSRDILNLWICGGLVFPAVGGANPSLTIRAVACRAADRIDALAARGDP